MLQNNFKFEVVEIQDLPESNEAKVILDVSSDFKYWFIQQQNLKRWSQKRFQKWFLQVLSEHLDKTKEGPKEKI